MNKVKSIIKGSLAIVCAVEDGVFTALVLPLVPLWAQVLITFFNACLITGLILYCFDSFKFLDDAASSQKLKPIKCEDHIQCDNETCQKIFMDYFIDKNPIPINRFRIFDKLGRELYFLGLFSLTHKENAFHAKVLDAKESICIGHDYMYPVTHIRLDYVGVEDELVSKPIKFGETDSRGL